MTGDLGEGKGAFQRLYATPDRMASLVAARICHDLVSPVGAIANGLDLLREVPSTRGEDFRMVEDSAARATLLLKFLRLAFGAADDAGSPLSGRELGSRLAVLGGPRVSVAVGVDDGAELKPTLARLAALMMLAARALLGREGRIRLSLDRTGLPMTAEAFGDRADWTDGRRRLADGHDDSASPRDVEFLLLGPFARAAGAHLIKIAEPGRAGLTAQSV